MITKSLASLLLLPLLLLLLHPDRAQGGAEHGAVGRVRRLGWGWGWPTGWWSSSDDNGAKEDEMFKNGVVFLLYTRENPVEPETVDVYDKDAPALQYFNAARPTKVVTHGWNTDHRSLNVLRQALLATMDVNLIAVKWSDCDSVFYPLSERHTPLVGERVALLISFLRDRYAVPARSLHLIGHSLGAHISGMAARAVGTVGRITGLDPAGPLIPVNETQRLDRSDALFVDVIHTCANVLGYRDAIGHVDFYPNGGTCFQPGCMLADLTQGTCSHGRGIVLLEESIYNRTAFKAFPCAGANSSPNKQDPGQSIVMGLDAPASARGSYCLTTRDAAPFAMPEAEQLSLHSVGSVGTSGSSDELDNELDNELRPEDSPKGQRIYRSFLRHGLAMNRRQARRRLALRRQH